MPISGPRAERIDKEIALIRSGAMRGDFMRRPGQRGIGQAEQRMIQQLTLQKMTPEERIAYNKRKADAARADAAARAVRNVFKSAKTETMTAAKTTPIIENLRKMSLDDSNPDQWLIFSRAIPMLYHRNDPLTKFRFNWGANGRPVYVAMTEQSWSNYFRHPQRGRWIPNQPFTYKCPPEWERVWIAKYLAESNKWARKYRNTDKRHLWPHGIGQAICKKPKKSLWVKIRKPLAIAAAIVATVYLGPIVAEKIATVAGGGGAGSAGAGAAAGGAGGAATGAGAAATGTTAASAAGKASLFAKIKSGANTVLGYVNKARTIKAIAEGEIPPPPIGITGSSFREYVFDVAKDQLKKEAIERAAEAGVRYVQKKMTAKEEAKLKAEIAEMQRELARLIPESTPMTPAPEVPAPVQQVMAVEKEKAQDANTGLAIAVPAALGFMLLTG